MTSMRMRAVNGIQVGDQFRVTRTFTEQDVIDFAQTSRDDNPVHFEDRFAAIKNFRGRICHGLLVGSLLTEIGGQLAMLASGMNFRFKRPVYFGDTITCTLVIDEMDQTGRVKCSATFSNQCGETVIEGQLFGVLPNEKERELLQKSQDE